MELQLLLLKYARVGIYIEILADCFKMPADLSEPPHEQVCWRPVVNWHQNGEWREDDCGCSSDLAKIMAVAERMAEDLFHRVYGGQPLNFQNVKPFRFSDLT